MSAGQQMPPWLQEQIGKMQQSQQNLQSILMQKQQVEMENAESDRALEELKKAADGDSSGLIKRMNDCFEEDKFQKRVVDLQDQKFREINNHFLDKPVSVHSIAKITIFFL